MKFALVNPNWSFEGSVYFGCREPHLPLEYGYAAAVLERRGHEARIIDGHLFDLTETQIRTQVEDFHPDFLVITTAPNYLFWRCAPPELSVPRRLAAALRDLNALLVAVGPHGSTVPRSVLRKLNADAVILGEFEDVLPELAERDWRAIDALCCAGADDLPIRGAPATARFCDLPPLSWPRAWIERHSHHHHRFDDPPRGPGAVIEGSRGCPYHCTFCAKENFRGFYRKRPREVLLRELDGLLRQGVEYVYFIDEIFLPDAALLSALAERPLKFGIQTRIDLWSPEDLALLGAAGCRSIEAGIESLSEEGRLRLGKKGFLGLEEMTERLVLARRHVPFVQANLLQSPEDDPVEVAAWRSALITRGVWANDPVPLFPYPGSPAYRNLFGAPDEYAYEKAHAWYLGEFSRMSDLQAQSPLPLPELEMGGLRG